jgi:outer membrane biosynthesis protein TonB
MRSALIFSGILHILLFVVIFFGLPSFLEKKQIENSAIVVEILPISDVTNAKPQKKSVKKPKAEEKQTAPAKVKPALPDPTIKAEPEMTKSKSKPEPTPEPVPQKVAEVKKPEVKKEKKKEEKPKEKAKPKEEKKKKPEKKKEPELDFGAVLNTLEEIESTQKEEKAEDKKDFSDIEDMLDTKEVQTEYKPGLPLTSSERDAIKNQITQNWSLISGAKDAHTMVVTLVISLSSDGTVTNVEKKDTMRYNTDPVFRAMVDSAERAVRKSSPLKNLPTEKYAGAKGWNRVEINFDPSEMMY